MHTSLHLLLFCLLLAVPAAAQKLKRSGFLGAKITAVTDSVAKVRQLPAGRGVLVQEVLPNSTAAALKVQPQDVLLQVNGKDLSAPKDLTPALGRWRAGDAVTLTVQRGKKQQTLKGKAVGKPFETSAVAEVVYDQVPFQQGHLRSIVSKPKTGSGRRPAILLIQGYNCGTVDNLGQGSYGKLVNGWAGRGYVVMRLEKPGVGDCEGTSGCDEIDLYTETKAFAAGLQQLRQYDYVDTANLFLFGHSMGGVIAPLIAEKQRVKGVIVYGTVFKPWFEFLLGMYRFQYPKQGTDWVETEATVRGLQQVLYHFFVEKKSPRQIAQQHPELAQLVEKELEYNGTDVMWTRHYKFWQQLDEINLAQSWKNTPSYVLSMQGEHDFESYDHFEHQYIADLINSYRPGKAQYLELEKTNHGFVKVPTVEEGQRIVQRGDRAYQDKNFNQDLVEQTDRWMKDKLVKPL